MSEINRKLKLRSKGHTSKIGNNVTSLKVHQFVDPKRPLPFENAKTSEAYFSQVKATTDILVKPSPALVKDSPYMNNGIVPKVVVAVGILGVAYLIWRG
jgi:hypothetical protein